jgi:hypothetical protein
MTIQKAVDALVIKDAGGTYYVLAPDVLERSRATVEQRTALIYGCDDRNAGGSISGSIRNLAPFQMLGVAPMPMPAGGQENPFWPGVLE